MGARPSFREEISSLVHAAEGNPLHVCMQCGTCSSTCPAARFMDHSPREIVGMIALGLRDKVLASNAYWFCASCYDCTAKCPRGINIAELMYGLKRYSMWRRKYHEKLIGPVFSSRFVTMIVKNGRSFEPGLAPAFIFRYGVMGMVRDAWMAFRLFLKGRMPLVPHRIKRIENFQRMVSRIIPVGRAA